MSLNLSAVGKKIGPVSSTYDWKDIVLYAVGVGAGFDELEYVYEDGLKVIPSFAVPILIDVYAQVAGVANVNLAGILHGEHDLILHSPIPAQGGELSTEGRITHMYDRGPKKGALVIAEATTRFEDGRKLSTNILTLFSRLDGGFEGEEPPKETFEFPDREPDFEESDSPSPDQPLTYRLSGDTFALHVDPEFARASGFEGPIMHGLCTHGYACRAVIKHLFPGEPERLTRFRNRFSRPLYPGTPIKTQIWKLDEGKAIFRTLNATNDEVVLDRGMVEWLSPEEAQRRMEAPGIRFDGQVAIVTGAGGGLGRAYALALAERGAKVVVNDLGGAADGKGKSKKAADAVVAEIKKAGGEAVANYDSVATLEGGEAIVETALSNYGRLDILINNAGILRDKSFAKMTPEMWQGVLEVHLQGAYNVTAPAFRAMREQEYGRIVLTTSAAGLFGNFGQANYGAAKMGLVGLMNTLKLEGGRRNIKVNTVAPLAVTRLTEDILPGELAERSQPEAVTPLVLYLCSELCPVSGGVYNAGTGYFGRAAMVSGPGAMLGERGEFATPEDVAAEWKRIRSLKGAKEYRDANAALMSMLAGPPEGEAEGEEAAGAEAAGSVAAVFEAMPERFKPEAAAGVEVVFQWNISGPGGGNWVVEVKEGACKVEAGTHASPTTTLKMSEGDFMNLIEGKLPAMQAYTAGKLKIEGDLMKSQLVQKLFKI
ncbi:MAG: SDR family NAD(P)-dependent oxidoreductase [Anaerolineales bacterium]|jgi:NAD(P)-dependent dehydrogenase (short-subunit alcohol dehydrogenase family)/acyl dehydratase